MHNENRGFTLIELLVVISIIGLLSSIVLTSVNSARAKARDTRRIADLKQIQLALELYYADNNAYPFISGVCNPGLNEHGDYWCRDTRNNNGATQIDNWIPGLAPYLPSMPHNPKPYAYNSWPYHYAAGTSVGGSSNNQKYWLMVMLENASPITCPAVTSIWYDGSSPACPNITGYGAGAYVLKNF